MQRVPEKQLGVKIREKSK